MVLGGILDADLQRTEQARALEHVQREAESDHLTGLLTRRGWDRRMALEEVRFARFGDPAAVLVLDLDGLKERNDAEGHRAGDRYLVRTGDVLRAVTRPADVVARLGGAASGCWRAGSCPTKRRRWSGGSRRRWPPPASPPPSGLRPTAS
jgi:predicted signal transduction protein with EAL and GGDEF domain